MMATCVSTDELKDVTLNDISQAHRDNSVWSHSYVKPKIRRLYGLELDDGHYKKMSTGDWKTLDTEYQIYSMHVTLKSVLMLYRAVWYWNA